MPLTIVIRLHIARVVALCLVWMILLNSRIAFADPRVIEGAKKEGELIWWSTIAQDQSQKIVDEFMKRYPFIKANYWRSGSVGLHNKIMIEARAGRSSWDVVSQTNPEFIFELKPVVYQR